MSDQSRDELVACLAQMRLIHERLAEQIAGTCVLHLEAAIAALESRLRRDAAASEQPSQQSYA